MLSEIFGDELVNRVSYPCYSHTVMKQYKIVMKQYKLQDQYL